MDKLKPALVETFGQANIWQCEYMPLVERLQIVIRLAPMTVLGKEHYSRMDIFKNVGVILMLCKMLGIEHDLRISFKLQSDLTVSDAIFAKKDIAAYEGDYAFDGFAEKWHIVSGLK